MTVKVKYLQNSLHTIILYSAITLFSFGLTQNIDFKTIRGFFVNVMVILIFELLWKQELHIIKKCANKI